MLHVANETTPVTVLFKELMRDQTFQMDKLTYRKLDAATAYCFERNQVELMADLLICTPVRVTLSVTVVKAPVVPVMVDAEKERCAQHAAVMVVKAAEATNKGEVVAPTAPLPEAAPQQPIAQPAALPAAPPAAQ
jgi:hypothetical protein